MTLTARRSLRVLAVLCSIVAINVLWLKPRLRAQEGPQPPGGFLELATSTDIRALVSAGELAGLLPNRGAFAFPAPYGTTGVRVTNASDCSNGDCVNPIGATFAHMSNSAGSSLMYVVVGLDHMRGGTGATVFQFDKTTGAVTNLGGLFDPNEDLALGDAINWYFSATQPTTFYVGIDRELRRYDVLTHAATTVFDVTQTYGDDKEIWDVHSSRDDRVHSFALRQAENGEPVGCGVYREDLAQFSLFPAQPGFDSCSVDRTGNWLLIKEANNNRIVNLMLGTETALLDANGAAGASDMSFNGMLAADDHNALPNAVRPWSFGPLTSSPVVYHDLAGQPSTFTSISFANARSAALTEQFACGSAASRTNGPRANEIVCVKLDGSLSTLVVAPVMTDLDAAGGGDDDAAKMPNAQIDPTGEYMLWTSNAMGARLDAFLVRVPSQNLVTPPSDTTAPTVAVTAPSQFTTVSGNSVSLTAAANDNVGVAGVQFTLDGVNLGSELTTAPYAWSWNTNTASDGVHVLTAVARDAAGNTTVSVPVSVTVANSATAPGISGITVSGIDQSGAFVSWNTNQLADGIIEYGPTAAYGSSTALDPALKTSHLMALTGLSAGATSHFRITSKNAQSLSTTTGDFTLTTSAALTIAGVGASAITDSSAAISWTTNLASSSQVEYGLTTAYGDATEFDDALATAHNAPIGGLLPGSIYHYRVYSVTGAGAVAVSGDVTFTTPTLPGGPGGVAPGGFVELATSTSTRATIPAGTLQGLMPARGAFTLPAPYHTTVVRITNDLDCSTGDCVLTPGGANWRNMSNSAGSNLMYIVLGLDRIRLGTGATVFSYNKTTQEVLNLGPLFDAGEDLTYGDASGWYFSGTQPTAFYVNIDQQLRRYDVLTRTFVTVFDVTAEFGSDKAVARVHSSRDDRVHSFTLQYAANGQPVGCGVYREDTHQFSLYPGQGSFKECQVDQTGRWLLIREDQDGLGGDDNRIIDLTNGAATSLLDAAGAGGASDLGFGMMLAADDHAASPNTIRPWGFGPLSAGPAVYHDLPGQPSTFTTISFTNARSASLDQQYACGSAVNRTNGPRANEIVCVKLDGSLSTLVVAPVMTDLDAPGGGDDDAAKMPNGNLDPTGEYFLWTSNAGGSRLDAFLVRVPSHILVTPPADTTAPTVAITSPVEAATVSGNSVSLAATAADEHLAGVQFKLDDVNLGSELTTAPFAWVWNTNTTTDGVHVLTAVARDAAGNTTISTPVAVTVNNSAGSPQITGVTASLVAATTAHINWKTNQMTDAQVEYGPTTDYGAASALNTSLSASHLEMLAGLTSGTTYHFRVLSRNGVGVLSTSGDFTFATTPAPVISGITAMSVTPSAALISWTTNLPANSQIEYGLTIDYGDATDALPALVTSHGVVLTGLPLSTTYHYRIYSVTAAGVMAVTPDQVFTTTNVPVLSNIAVSGLGEFKATINWTSDLAADSRVEYGLTAAYGSTTPLNATLVTNHGVVLTGLAAGTTYHYRVLSTNLAGMSATSGDFAFTTRVPEPAVWMNLVKSEVNGDVLRKNSGCDDCEDAGARSQQVLTSGDGYVQFTVTDLSRNFLIGLGTGATTTSGDEIAYTMWQGNGVTIKEAGVWRTFFNVAVNDVLRIAVVDGVVKYTKNGTVVYTSTVAPTYPLRVDTSLHSTAVTVNAIVVLDLFAAPAPGISGPSATAISDSAATIGWTTDQAATTAVEYGPTTNYGSAPPPVAPLTSAHGVTLGSLSQNTVYHYRVRSTNSRGLESVSADSTFTTLASGPVSWTTMVNSGVLAGNVLSKIAGCNDCEDAGAVSQQVISHGDGYVELRVTDLTRNYFIGLSNGDPGTSGAEIKYAMWQGNGVTIKEAGVSQLFFPVAVNDVLRIGIVNGVVKYFRNGAVVFTSPTPPVYPLRVDTSLRSTGVLVTDATIAGDPLIGTVPVITGAVASGLTNTTANITWTTDIAADSVIEYGPTTAYGLTLSTSALVSRHSDELVDLTPGSIYHVRVGSTSGLGLPATSPDFTFITYPSPQLITWTHLVNASVVAGSLTKTAGCNGCEDAGAISQQVLTGGKGYLQYTVTDVTKGFAIGLSNVDTGTTRGEINYAIWQSSAVSILEQGVSKAVFTIALNDVLLLDVNDGVVTYYKNGTLMYTSTTPVSYPLFVDTSLNATNAAVPANAIFAGDPFEPAAPVISNVGASDITDLSAVINWMTDHAANSQVDYGVTTAYGSTTTLNTSLALNHNEPLTGLAPNTTYHYRVRSSSSGFTTQSGDLTFTTLPLQPVPEPVNWTDLVNTTLTGNVLQKTSGVTRGLDAGAVSQQMITEGYMQFTVTEVNKWRVIGLSPTSTGTSDLEIVYSFWLHDGVAEVRENPTFGVDIHQATTPIAVGDVLRVSVTGGVVKYWKNGTVFYTSTYTATLPLLVDVTLLDLNSTIVNAVVVAGSGSAPSPEPSPSASEGGEIPKL